MSFNFKNTEEEREEKEIYVATFMKKLGLNLEEGNKDDKIKLSSLSVNRPGLFLAGFEDYFANSRIQVFGNAEWYYVNKLSEEERRNIFNKLCERDIPCIVFSRGLRIPKELKILAKKNNIPIFKTKEITSHIINEIINFLNDFLAEEQVISAELLKISGIGVLITGFSGLGKSETALDLITRGHKLIADDLVNVKRVKDEIIGTAPDKIRHYMEVRGIGIINVQKLYGVGSVLSESKIDFVIELKKFEKEIKLERLGQNTKYYDILGVNVPKLEIPVGIGRNLANIIEVATNNFRLKELGDNTLEEFIKHTF